MNFCHTIIPGGPNKGARLYLENFYGSDEIFPEEIYFIFIKALKNDYKIFHITCEPNHNIIMDKKDLEYISIGLTHFEWDKNLNLYYSYSDTIKKLKEYQYNDVLKLMNLITIDDKTGWFFFYPVLKDNKYYFNFFIASKNSFNLNNLFNLNFDLIKLKSFNEYSEQNLSLNFIKNIYDLKNVFFKNYYADYYKSNRCYFHDKYETIEYDCYYIICNQFEDSGFDKNIKILFNNKSIEKHKNLRNSKTFKKLIFSLFCWNFYFIHEKLNCDVFFTNFFQMIGAGVVDMDFFEKNKLQMNYDVLSHYSFDDMTSYDDYFCFSSNNDYYRINSSIGDHKNTNY